MREFICMCTVIDSKYYMIEFDFTIRVVRYYTKGDRGQWVKQGFDQMVGSFSFSRSSAKLLIRKYFAL